jgi:fatty acyl-CoA reductase
MESLDDAQVESLTPKILGTYPNSYAFTKALAEALVEEASKEIPAIITRPSNIIPILREPIPGWGDSLNGAMGLMVAAGKGALRVVYGNIESFADFVPVDLLANAICISTWNYVALKYGTIMKYFQILTNIFYQFLETTNVL